MSPHVSTMPALSPASLLPRFWPLERTFPFDHAAPTYCYFARNAIHAIARHWRLDGREVLFPAYFHGVELDALLAAGVRPSFFPVDCRMQVDPDEIMRRIGPETRAVYLIHYLGFPGPIRELTSICQDRGIKLIEDCALGLLSRSADAPLGTFGDAAVFCLYKTLPVPNGGVLVVNRGTPPSFRRVAPPLRAPLSSIVGSLSAHLESHGHARVAGAIAAASGWVRQASSTVANSERVEVGTQEFDPAAAALGMSAIVHVLLNSQRHAQIVAARRRNFLLLHDRLRSCTTAVVDDLPDGVCPLFYPLRAKNKVTLMSELQSRGIETINFWSASHRFLPEGIFPDADTLRRAIVEVPCHQDLEPETMEYIADVLVRSRDLLH